MLQNLIKLLSCLYNYNKAKQRGEKPGLVVRAEGVRSWVRIPPYTGWMYAMLAITYSMKRK